MGGNALKSIETRRYAADEYKDLCAVINQKLYGFGYMVNWHIIDAYRTKESFGDMDLLYTSYDDRPLCVEDIGDIFSDEPPREIVRNGSYISFDFRELQIDFIHSPIDEYFYARDYFAWNDLGNLVGKIARRFGLKHGHRGLTLPLRDGTQEFDEIIITQNHEDTLEFLDLDPVRFDNGFDTLEEIFHFVKASKYFDQETYKLENVSYAGRIRDKKRSTYQQFLKFIEENESQWGPALDLGPKESNLARIFDYFPDAKGAFDKAISYLMVQRSLKEKFNGAYVSQLTGLTNKDLGEFMKHIRKVPEFDKFYLLHYTPSYLEELTMHEFNKGTWKLQ